jgi:hypothetical protein
MTDALDSAYCRKPILPGQDKMTIQDVPYHMACWDQKNRERPRGARLRRGATAALNGLPMRRGLLDPLDVPQLHAVVVQPDRGRTGRIELDLTVLSRDRLLAGVAGLAGAATDPNRLRSLAG